ncbi:hypothetical protein D6C82_00268 [Aureobasidium pullulans]|nr:hypothetical protein D6C82_00268 [Aureobasidium pullulans]
MSELHDQSFKAVSILPPPLCNFSKARSQLTSHSHLPHARVHLREAFVHLDICLVTRCVYRDWTRATGSGAAGRPSCQVLRDRSLKLATEPPPCNTLAAVLLSFFSQSQSVKSSEAFQVRDRASFFFPLEFAFAIHGLSAMSLPEADPPSGTSSLKKTITRGHSCMTCSARKVRCDGQRPCATCTKSAVPCSSKPTQPARAKAANAAKRARDRGNVSSTIEHTPDLDKQQSSVAEHINDQGHSHYVENPTNQEDSETDLAPTPLTNSNPFVAESLILGASTVNLADKHPDPACLMWLWQTFLENVNAPVKILHIPTVQKIILGVASGLSKALPANKEALCFCIYLIAICSVPHCNHDECERIMGQPMDESINLYTGLAQQALVNARFIQKPNFTTLQAFALFLVSKRTRFEPNVLWQLTGLAIRAAQQMGYHREQALGSPSVSIFQAELRRRLWWELVLLESFSAKQCGVRSVVSSRSFWDTKRPLNINDTDLHPEMCHSLEDYRGMTEMSFCSARFEIGSFTIDHSGMDKSSQNVDEVDSRIEELLKGLHDRLLKYCDPSVPMHNMLLLFSRGATTRVKLTVRRHHMYAKGAGLSLEERDKTFLLCLQLTEVPNSFSKNKEIQKFIWQAMAFFPLDALLFMLGEIAYRTEQPPPEIDRAWEEIERSFELQPRLLHDESNAMYSAVRNLTLKAWDRSVNRQWIGSNVPRFIQLLRSRSLAIRSTDSSVNLIGTSGALEILDESPFNFDTESLDPSWSKIVIPDDPEFWAYWQQFDAELSGV